MEKRQTFKSVLDYKPKFENVIDTIMPDIEHSYAAIMNNTNIQTYFNMFSMELYDLEYFQILRANNLQFKINAKSINLTVLEMVYNIISKIKERGLKIPDYIGYDMHILPARIETYIKLINYKFVETETIKRKIVVKLVADPMRDVLDELVDNHHDDAIANLVNTFKMAESTEYASKITAFKNLFFFIKAGEAIIFQKFGITWGQEYIDICEKLFKIKSEEISEKDIKLINKNLDDIFMQSLLLLHFIDDSMKRGVWDKIKASERRRIELKVAEQIIQDANAKVLEIKKEEKYEKTLELNLNSATSIVLKEKKVLKNPKTN